MVAVAAAPAEFPLAVGTNVTYWFVTGTVETVAWFVSLFIPKGSDPPPVPDPEKVPTR